MAEGTGNNLFLKFHLSHKANTGHQLIHKLARPMDLTFTSPSQFIYCDRRDTTKFR